MAETPEKRSTHPPHEAPSQPVTEPVDEPQPQPEIKPELAPAPTLQEPVLQAEGKDLLALINLDNLSLTSTRKIAGTLTTTAPG